jgi:hypothetical protein
MTRVLVWIAPAGWEACVDTALALPAAEVTLLQVAEAPPAPGGLLGRRPHHVPAPPADDLLDAAQERLGRPGRAPVAVRPARARGRRGLRPAGPLAHQRARRSALARYATRFVVDHAPCPILLVWPGLPEGTGGPPPV